MVNKKQQQLKETGDEGETNQSTDENLKKCEICGEYHDKSITHGIEIKGKKKYICQDCADTIHGLV